MNSRIAVKRLSEVFKVDSITSSDSDFMATHVPFRNISFMQKSGLQENIKQFSEDSIYESLFCDDSKKNEHQFIIVQGSSGAGKSHFIRWLNAKLVAREVDDDVVILIKRSDNTLKGTIKQLLNIEEVKNIKNKDVYERLVKANTTISDRKFKDSILHNFIIEIKNDERETELNGAKRKNLTALLSNEEFETRLLQSGGPIDRIFNKVSSETSSGVQDTVALFEVNDFILDIDFADRLRESGADGKAIRIAEKLIPDGDDISFSETVTKYINTLVDNVVQNCAGIEAGDFQQIFREIRQELKSKGKNLILLIEDVTAFTGVNQALLNALATEHTGLNETDNLCRIISVVGTTDQYYSEFRDNYKNRITTEITINDGAIGENPDDLIQFVARYLNVISTESEIVNEWYKNGAQSNDYPVHEILEGVGWDYYNLNDNLKLNLYPFTKNAIINLYNASNFNKTPRYILKYLIEKGVSDIIHNKAKFPSFCSDLSLENLKPDDEIRIVEIVDSMNIGAINEQYKSRLEYLISFWGDNTLTSTPGKLSGINVSIFNELGFEEFVKRVYTSTEPLQSDVEENLIANDEPITEKTMNNSVSHNSNGLSTNNNAANAASNHEENTTLNKHTKSEPAASNPQPDVMPEVKASDSISSAQKIKNNKYTEFQRCARDWFNEGKVLPYSVFAVRDEICDFILQTINWQQEGIATYTKNKLKEGRKIIAFENQERGIENALIVLPCDISSYKLLIAMGRYVYLGEKSWNFENSSSSVYVLTSWLHKYKSNIINKVKNDVVDNIPKYVKYSMIAELYIRILTGNVSLKKSTDVNTNFYISNPIEKPNAVSGHSEIWNEVTESLFNQDGASKIHTAYIDYFRTTQGASFATAKYLMRYSEIEAVVSMLVKNNFSVAKTELSEKEDFAFKNEIREYLDKLIKKIPDTIKAETTIASEVYKQLLEIFGFDKDDIITEDDVITLLDNALDFYNEAANFGLNLWNQNDTIIKCKKNASIIVKDINMLSTNLDGKSDIDKLLHFSSNPIRNSKSFLNLLIKINKDVTDSLEKLKSQSSQLRINSSGGIDYNKKYDENTNMFNELYSKLMKEGE